MPPIVLLLLGLGAAGVAVAMSKKRGAPSQSEFKQAIYRPDSPGFSVPENVSKHFKTSEFLNSKTVPELKNYKPLEWEFKNLQRLAFELLEPIREHIKAPIYITSGGRPTLLNVTQKLREAGYDAVPGGDHEAFLAADIVTPDMDNLTKAYAFALKQPTLRQAVLYTGLDGKPTHLHLSVVAPGKPQLKSIVKVATKEERPIV